MGNAISTPESMKNIPSKLNKDEYLQMTYDGTIYCIQKRSLGDQMSAGFKQNFTTESFAMDALGLGAFRNMNKQKTGNFYVSLDNPLNEPIPTTANSTNLSWFIKAFAFEKDIKLKDAVFELKNLTKKEENEIKKEEIKEQKEEIKEIKKELSSFGKKRKKVLKEIKKFSKEIKELHMDLKKVRSF
jgi:hypothetical protein